MLFNNFLFLKVCLFLSFIFYLFIHYKIYNESFKNKNYASETDYRDSLKSKYYILKGGENEKSLLSKINLYIFTK